MTALIVLFPPARGWFALDEPTDVTHLAALLLTGLGLAVLVHLHRSARAELEAARRTAERHAARLEREVAERRRAESALLQSNTDLEDFSHAVSHDLKEPLRGIAATAEFLLEDHGDRLGDDGRAKLETLVRLPKQMTAMLGALLEYSRVGRAEFALRPVDAAELVAAAVDPLQTWLDDHRAEVAVEGPLPTLNCDAARVTQVFANLIANAVKYNEACPKRVQVGVAGAGAAPVFFVRDNGIGIAPHLAPGVFRMFRRLHDAKAYGGGSGSGLALCKRTIERHGGRIWFDSEPGQGTTFYFTLQPGDPPPALTERGSLAQVG